MVESVKAGGKCRGRPIGSGVDDTATLASVADLLAAEPGLKPSTAIKRTVKKIGASQLRRLQVKWKQGGAALLAAAQQRRKERQTAQNESERRPTAAWSNYAAAALGPGFSHAVSMASSPLIEQARKLALGRQDYIGVRLLDSLNPQLGIDQETLRAITGSVLPPALQAIATLAKPEWMKHLDTLGAGRQALSTEQSSRPLRIGRQSRRSEAEECHFGRRWVPGLGLWTPG